MKSKYVNSRSARKHAKRQIRRLARRLDRIDWLNKVDNDGARGRAEEGRGLAWDLEYFIGVVTKTV